MAQISTRGPPPSRRAGLLLVAVAIVLAIGAFFLGNTYLTAEAAKVNAPVRTVYAASRDIAAGTLLRAEDLATTSMALPDQLAGFFLVQTPGAPPPAGVAAIDPKMGQPRPRAEPPGPPPRARPGRPPVFPRPRPPGAPPPAAGGTLAMGGGWPIFRS